MLARLAGQQKYGTVNIYVSYIKTNNPVSAYTLHIFNNRQEYGCPEHTTQLLKACGKGKVMNCWMSFYMQVLQQRNLLIDEQKTNEPSQLYALANVTKHVTQLDTQYISAQHNGSLNIQVSPSLHK
jgi:hypothetical protein